MTHATLPGWTIAQFDQVAEIVTGSTPSTTMREYYDGPVPFVAPADLDRGLPILRAKSSLSKLGAQQARLVPKGSVLVCCIGATIGKVGIAGTEVATNQQINSLVFNPDKVNCQYAYYYCQTLREIIQHSSTSTTLPILNKGRFSKFEITLPPLPEQKRIADILDKADSIRRKRQEAVQQFGLLTESLFNEMFSHKLASTRWSDLSNYLEELRYGTSNKSGDGGYTTLRIPNIVRGIIDLGDLKNVTVSEAEFSKLSLVSGDVLFVRTNGNPDYVGRCAVFEPSQMKEAGLNADKVIYASYLIRARLQLDRLRPVFLQSLLQTSAGRKNVREKCRTSAGQYNINTQGIGALQIPDMDVKEQIDFENRVASLRPVLSSLTKAHSEADDLFNSLVQHAFKGELSKGGTT